MVELLEQHNGSHATLVLKPNAAMPWRQNLYVIALFAIGVLGFATFWAFNGAILALPFGILEILGLTWAMWWVARQAQRQQTIELSEHEVVIRSGIKSIEKEWRGARQWTRVEVEKGKRKADPPTIWFCYRDQRVEVGDFLNRRDRTRLLQTLKQLINGPLRLPPS